ncbi:phage tail-like protein [Anaerobacterium chartisolvens]|uniref:Phage tail-like protein n=1 Tax=Anaerobacterium chartisolvens TaxID=1297424 RepID=A0A369AQS3_9FIRM|nr:phage tail protein [Anaerobacterium chartisolvens]RCX11373.1 phage tail-like protein [Anaerobacterium chartisolvens]
MEGAYTDNELKKMTLAGDLWRAGFRDNFIVDSSGCMVLESSIRKGIFFSRSVDMLESEMTYNRMVINAVYSQHSNIQIRIRASDNAYMSYRGGLIQVDDFLAEPEVDTGEKQELFEGKDSIRCERLSDILLHRLKGRYIWICLKAIDTGEGEVVFKSIHIEFPQKSFIEYLPEIYQKDSDFLTRYLAVFQSVYTDMERSIDRLPMLLDADAVSGGFLDYLASWLGVNNEGAILDTTQFKYIVKNALTLNKAKGTVWSIIDMVRLYTGEEPYIIEFFELRGYAKGNRERELLYHRLYTDNPHTFCIVLKNQEVFERGGKLEELSCLIEKVRPSHTVARIIVLKQGIRLDMHSYMGINSRLHMHTAGSIGENTTMDGGFYLNA